MARRPASTAPRRVHTLRTSLIGLIGLAAQGAPGLAAQVADDSFTATYERLRRGPAHSPDAPTGRLELTRENEDGLLHRYVLIVPDDYDPSRRYPVAFYLHGGVSRPNPGPGGGWWRNYDHVAGHDRIAVLPLSWSESLWWQASQVENLQGILSEVKRTYNVDENRVYAFGTSDGGTGVYFLGFREATPWAAFLPFIGDPGVLLNPQVGADGQMHLANLTNKPFFIVNGETDPLYPVRVIVPFLSAFQRAGVDFVFAAKPGGHNTRWWPEEEENIERFIEAHRRTPHPERILWATERTDRYNRAHWLVIDQVGFVSGDDERNELTALTADDRAGVVEAIRSDNTVTATTYNVRRFTVLISPDAFDLRRPVRVIANDETRFEGIVRPELGTLRKWAARDEDRTMLYAVEITVELRGAR
jgi:predicted esterase